MGDLSLPPPILNFLTGRHVRVSFSGGADSVALLLALREHAGQGAFQLSAVHFEHGLRGAESLQDAEFCRAFCRRISVPLTVESLSMSPGPGSEAQARAMRHARWKRMLADDPNGVVALGHTADDRIETLFLRLLRGSNASGLAALRPIRIVDGVVYVRPLLGWSRRDTERVADPFGYRIDSTNATDAFLRNRIRNRLLPVFWRLADGAREGLLRACDSLDEDAAHLEEQAERLYAAEQRGGKKAVLSFAFLRGLDSAMLDRVLRRFLSDRFGSDFVPNRALVKRIQAGIAARPSGAKRIPVGKRMLLLSRDGLSEEVKARPERPADSVWRFRAKPAAAFGDCVLRFVGESRSFPFPAEKNDAEALFDAELAGSTFRIAVRRPGERMIPFGGTEPVKLKKLFANAKTSEEERSCLPVVRSEDGTPIWIPGIRRSSFAPVEPGRPALLFRCEKILRVVAVVLVRDGRILACSRPSGKPHAGMWEFPGGKIEPGETPEDCAVREIREELAAEIVPLGAIHEMEHDYGDKFVRVSFYAAELRSGEPQSREGQEIRWLEPEELERTPFLPADRPFAERIRRIFSETNAIKWNAASFYERMSARMEQHGTAS